MSTWQEGNGCVPGFNGFFIMDSQGVMIFHLFGVYERCKLFWLNLFFFCFMLVSIAEVCKCIIAIHVNFKLSVCFSCQGTGGAYWKGVSHFAGTHQDGLLVPVQPGRPKTYHVLWGHHHSGRFTSLIFPLFAFGYSLHLTYWFFFTHPHSSCE